MQSFLSIIAALLVGTSLSAQKAIQPGKNIVDASFLKEQHFSMDWFMRNGDAKKKVDSIDMVMLPTAQKFVVITQTRIEGVPSSWIDSSVCDLQTLRPIYHSSYNMQRNMVLRFGNPITGYYADKNSDKTDTINDSTTTPYFDSNLYIWLVTWLPLQQGSAYRIPLYDFNPKAKGVEYADVTDVKDSVFTSNKEGIRKIWRVTSRDHISGSDNQLTYFIDQKDRRLWKLEIAIAGRKMEQIRVE
ncbi:MAG: hypothetical protein QM610_03735 [Chitinophagaceae bacterium]